MAGTGFGVSQLELQIQLVLSIKALDDNAPMMLQPDDDAHVLGNGLKV